MPTPRRPVASADCRCACGSLVARLVPEGVELKCRRCKRTLVVALSGPDPVPTPASAAEPAWRSG
jgi:hypothetical protein